MSRSFAPSPAAALAAALIAVLALVGAACGEDEPEAFAGFVRSPTPSVSEATLPAIEADGSEEPFTFEAGDGDLLLVYFGYTSCPDVCPTTLSDLRRMLADMDEGDAERVDLAMITIDPEVDTPEILTGYVRSFVPEATAIRTLDDPALRTVADAFGADYGKLEGDDGEPQVYHTGSVYAVDETGHLLLSWPFGTPSEDMQADVTRLLAGEVPEEALR